MLQGPRTPSGAKGHQDLYSPPFRILQGGLIFCEDPARRLKLAAIPA